MPAAFLRVVQGQQDLRDRDTVRQHRLLERVRQSNLTGRCGGLFLFQPQIVVRQAETPPAGRDGARRYDQHLLTRGAARGHVRRKRLQPRTAHLSGFVVDDQRGADLDDHTSRGRETVLHGSKASSRRTPVLRPALRPAPAARPLSCRG